MWLFSFKPVYSNKRMDLKERVYRFAFVTGDMIAPVRSSSGSWVLESHSRVAEGESSCILSGAGNRYSASSVALSAFDFKHPEYPYILSDLDCQSTG